MPRHAITDEEIESCYDVILELRPHLERETFLSVVRTMEKEGYHLAFKKFDGEVVAVAGYRIYSNLFMGKHLYVDDLVTASEYRSRGFGKSLIIWLKGIARNSGCNWFDLDSGTHRGRAHRFYFNLGLTIASYHFSEKL
ncbi:MAG: GNAT family N-acetyltransferase [Deltaproteobacteria bacterium]|nr:GNAT family N-acetyltransferase [Deltaproteobacteria bacterium]